MNMHTLPAVAKRSAAILPPKPAGQPLSQDKLFLECVGYCITHHRKALRAAEGTPIGSPEHKAANAALLAVARARPVSGRDGARQLQHIWQSVGGDAGQLAQILNLDQFTADLVEITAFKAPTKALGELNNRNGTVTRSGLLYRYHSYLALELARVGFELYGDDRCAREFVPMDGYVQRVVHKQITSAKLSAALPRRAKKALRALGINATSKHR
jgi:hypothetical protein